MQRITAKFSVQLEQGEKGRLALWFVCECDLSERECVPEWAYPVRFKQTMAPTSRSNAWSVWTEWPQLSQAEMKPWLTDYENPPVLLMVSKNPLSCLVCGHNNIPLDWIKYTATGNWNGWLCKPFEGWRRDILSHLITNKCSASSHQQCSPSLVLLSSIGPLLSDKAFATNTQHSICRHMARWLTQSHCF